MLRKRVRKRELLFAFFEKNSYLVNVLILFIFLKIMRKLITLFAASSLMLSGTVSFAQISVGGGTLINLKK